MVVGDITLSDEQSDPNTPMSADSTVIGNE